jgi:hypothetical protein
MTHARKPPMHALLRTVELPRAAARLQPPGGATSGRSVTTAAPSSSL